jgi:hypothetical protein
MSSTRPPKNAPDPVQEVKPFFFSAQQRTELLSTLPGDVKAAKTTFAKMEKVATDYLWRRAQHTSRWSRSEKNAALKEIEDLSRKLATRLEHLDMELEWELIYSAARAEKEIAPLVQSLRFLEGHASYTLKAGKEKSGPRPDSNIHRAVTELAQIYRQMTGRAITHNPKRQTEYTGRPESTGGRFVVAFFAAVDPSIAKTKISQALAAIVRKTPRSNFSSRITG